MKKRTRDAWISPPFPLKGIIQTKPLDGAYNWAAKEKDAKKHLFNDNVCALLEAVLDFWVRIDHHPAPVKLRALVLDDANMLTTRSLIRNTQLTLSDIDVVSRNVKFRKVKSRKTTGVLFTGEMSDFLCDPARHDAFRYDLVVLDFCANFGGPGTLESIESLFENILLELASGLVVTFAMRTTHGTAYVHQAFIEADAYLRATATEHGYHLGNAKRFINANVFSIYYRVLRPQEALHKVRGWGAPASNWLLE